MTPDERLKQFVEAYDKLCIRFGVALQPCLMINGLGEVHLKSDDKQLFVKPVIISDWKPDSSERESQS